MKLHRKMLPSWQAALLAPLEFNFGELLEKPLIKQELPKAQTANNLKTL